MCPSSLLFMGDASRASRDVVSGLVIRWPEPEPRAPANTDLTESSDSRGSTPAREVPRAPCGSACTGSEPLRGAYCVSRVSLTLPGPPGPQTPAHG